mgnify:CR=1 FL=1
MPGRCSRKGRAVVADPCCLVSCCFGCLPPLISRCSRPAVPGTRFRRVRLRLCRVAAAHRAAAGAAARGAYECGGAARGRAARAACAAACVAGPRDQRARCVAVWKKREGIACLSIPERRLVSSSAPPGNDFTTFVHRAVTAGPAAELLVAQLAGLPLRSLSLSDYRLLPRCC